MLSKLLFWSLVIVCAFCSQDDDLFEVPDALVEPLSPRGLRVSIPDVEGIKLFAFHGKVNEEFEGLEGGSISRDVIRAKNGRWTFYDSSVRIKPGDIIYYWTYVDYFDGKNKLGYQKLDQKFVVTELITRNTSTTTQLCETSITKINNLETCRGKLIFEDQFSTPAIDKWTKEVHYAGPPDYEFVIYTDDSEVLTIKNGHLHIKPALGDQIYEDGFVKRPNGLDLGSSCTGTRGTTDCFQIHRAWMILPPVISSKINTRNKFSFRYGKVEVRAKLPKGDWIYPELFLEPKSHVYGPHYESGQIRIAFLRGNEDLSNILYGGAILGNTTAARNYAVRNTSIDGRWNDDFHTFGVMWTNEKITLTVDNLVYGNIFPPESSFAHAAEELQQNAASKWRAGSRMAPFDQEMFISLGVGVGGHSFADHINNKPWINSDPKSQLNFYKAINNWNRTWGENSELIVDYIKVWAM